MILRNARLLPLAGGLLPDPVDLGIRDGLLCPPHQAGGESVDLDGRVVIPGLWDQHVHLGQWAIHQHRWQVPEVTSAAECAQALAPAVAVGDQAPFVGVGYRSSGWPDEPSAAVLDAQVPDTPVVLVSADMHSVWLNTAALRWFGLDHPSGVLVEQDAFDVELRISQVPTERLDEWVNQAAAEAAALGIVGVTDVECSRGDLDWARRSAAGSDRLRVRASVWPQDLDDALADGFRTGRPIGALATCGALKVIVDGSLGSRTASLTEPYQASDSRGVLNVQAEELMRLMTLARGAGVEVAAHAIGDAAVSVVLDCFEATGARGRVEHACLLPPGDADRMVRLGIAASVQPSHLGLSPDGTARALGERAQRVQPLRELADAGVELLLGSDAPVVPLSPWPAIADAVSAPHPVQRLTLSEALLASTNGVRMLHWGGAADLVVLDHNPFDLDPADLAGLTSALTLVKGGVTHERL